MGVMAYTCGVGGALCAAAYVKKSPGLKMSRSSTQSRGTSPRSACSRRPAATPSSTATEPSPKYLELWVSKWLWCGLEQAKHAPMGYFRSKRARKDEEKDEDSDTPFV